MNPGIFTSKKTTWSTPKHLFNALNSEFMFTLDVCAIPENAKCDNFFTPELNGLFQEWNGNICWMNPPYGRKITYWIKKAYLESRLGSVVVALLPARTDTKWFHEYILGIAEIRFLPGRLYFNDSEGRAPFPSMVVIWKNKETR
jgi:phage N-6-adenine-methyltransferase